MASFVASLARVVIERVSPELDGGRYPIKRTVGDLVKVEADIYADGHGLLAARVLYRRGKERGWREAPLEYRYDVDRWFGRFRVDQPGRWQYAIEAWPDRFGTWRDHLEKFQGAGQLEDVATELREGATLLERALAELPRSVRGAVRDAAACLGDPDCLMPERLAVAFSAELSRQVYGPLLDGDSTKSHVLELVVDRKLASFAAWYEMFPRSQGTKPGEHGTFRDAQMRLRELAELGFDVVYLAPIHPIGRVNRKGRNNLREAEAGDVGSPWAIGSVDGGHMAVHPELGTLDDFASFVRTARAMGMEVALDYALQCAADHPWVTEHPEWFYARADGTIRYAENPPKKYEDIYPLNFWCADREHLWTACKDILLFWIQQGVRIFRVDNPHTKPFPFWEWLIREVQAKYPDVIFLAEAFTRPKRMYGLAKLGFTQSYTYFTWKNAKWELGPYLEELNRTEVVEFFRPNCFTNTPDILHEYLQKGGRTAFRVRLLLAATSSPLYGIYSGFELCENVAVRRGSEEYLNSEKYEIRVRDWNAPGNLKPDIAHLNKLRREHAALQEIGNLSLLRTDSEDILAYRRSASQSELFVVVNLDPHRTHDTTVELPLGELGLRAEQPFEVEDLLTGTRYLWRGPKNYVKLDPAERVGHLFRLVRVG
jgi:starch synthase (maltosyl-transferring)